MCILIKQPEGHTFTKRQVKDFWDRNSDGFGIMFGNGKELHTLRMVGGFKQVWRNYREHAAGKACLLHWRMATHGAATAENAHPFMVTPDIALMHNGCLDMGNPVFKTWTDTQHLVEFFLRPIAEANPDVIFDPEWGKMLGSLIGSSNRLAFAHADGRMALVNASYGVTYRGCWYSNTYAWDAPSELVKVTSYRYASTGDYSKFASGGGYSLTRAYKDEEEAVAPDPANMDADDANAWAEELALDDAARAYFTRGVTELADWCRTNAEDAVAVLTAFRDVDEAEAASAVADYPMEAVALLEEVINAERDESYFTRTASLEDDEETAYRQEPVAVCVN